jgi:hypothetical protein
MGNSGDSASIWLRFRFGPKIRVESKGLGGFVWVRFLIHLIDYKQPVGFV